MLIHGIERIIAPDSDLHLANLSEADLHRANLRGANLSGANLSEANLSEADLYEANLSGADLSEANLYGANLSGANLSGADLRGAIEIPVLVAAQLSILPAGELRGFKRLADGTICELSIPADAKRSNASGRKCRCDRATVVSGEGVSLYDSSFAYSPGLVVRPRKPFDDDRWNECSSGIHFFITKAEAEAM